VQQLAPNSGTRFPRIDEIIEMQHGIDTDLTLEQTANARRDDSLSRSGGVQHDDDGVIGAIDTRCIPETLEAALGGVLCAIVGLGYGKVCEARIERQRKIDDEGREDDAEKRDDDQQALCNARRITQITLGDVQTDRG